MKLYVLYSPDAARDYCVFGVYDDKSDAEKAKTSLNRYSDQDGYGWMRYEIIERTLNENRS